jgi:hypothetical protein
MHAFVSSRYVVIEHVPGRRGGLPPSVRHDRFTGQAVEFGEPCINISEHRFHEHASTGTPHTYAIAFEPEFAGQPDGLAAPVSKQLCR